MPLKHIFPNFTTSTWSQVTTVAIYGVLINKRDLASRKPIGAIPGLCAGRRFASVSPLLQNLTFGKRAYHVIKPTWNVWSNCVVPSNLRENTVATLPHCPTKQSTNTRHIAGSSNVHTIMLHRKDAYRMCGVTTPPLPLRLHAITKIET